MESEKKTYSAPQVTEYGDVREITLFSNKKNADSPNGNDGTAFSP